MDPMYVSVSNNLKRKLPDGLAGFPGQSMDEMALVEEEAEEGDAEGGDGAGDPPTGSKPVLDPRAGHVDVVLPQIRFDPSQVAEVFAGRRATVEGKMRRVLAKQAKKFSDLAEGRYPFAHRYRVCSVGRLSEMKSSMKRHGKEAALWEAADRLDQYVAHMDEKPFSKMKLPAGMKKPPSQDQLDQEARRGKKKAVTDEERFRRFVERHATAKSASTAADEEVGVSQPKKAKMVSETALSNGFKMADEGTGESSTCNSTSPRWTVVSDEASSPLTTPASLKKKSKAGEHLDAIVETAPATKQLKVATDDSDRPSKSVAAPPSDDNQILPLSVSTPPRKPGKRVLYTPDPAMADIPFPTFYPLDLVELSPSTNLKLPPLTSPPMIAYLPGPDGTRPRKSPGTRSPLAATRPSPKTTLLGIVDTPTNRRNISKSGDSPVVMSANRNTATPVMNDVRTPQSAGMVKRWPHSGNINVAPALAGSGEKSSQANVEALNGSGTPRWTGEGKKVRTPGSDVKVKTPGSDEKVKTLGSGEVNTLGSEKKVKTPGSEKKVKTPGSDVKVETPGSEKKVKTPGSEKKVKTPGSDVKVKTPGSDVKVETPGSDVKVETHGSEKKVKTPGSDVKVKTPGSEKKVKTPGSNVKVKTPGSGEKVTPRVSDEVETLSTRKSSPANLERSGKKGDSPHCEAEGDEIQVSTKRAPKRNMSQTQAASAKRRSLHSDVAENKALTALMRGEEAARRTSPRKNKVAAAVAKGDAKKQLAFDDSDEAADSVAALPRGKRLSLNVVTPSKAAVAALRRQSLGSVLEEEAVVPSSPKRTSLRLAQKTRLLGKGKSPTATPPASATDLLTLTPADILKTPGAKAALLTSAKRAMSLGGTTTPKKVNIALRHNVAQEVSEYQEALRDSPGIPYDAHRRPAQGVLKAAAVRSPVNPFYLLAENARLNRLQPQPK